MSESSSATPGIVQPVTFKPVTLKPAGLKSAAEIGNMSLPELIYVLERTLTPGLAMFAGKPKGGKSFLLVELALAVVTGRPYLGRKTAKGNALYYALEDNYSRIQRRLNQLSGGMALPDELDFVIESTDINALKEQVAEWIDWAAIPRLVVVDIMARVVPSSSGGKPDYNHNTQVLGELQKFALERDVAIVMVNHTRKGDKGDKASDIFDEAIGSTGINGVMDTIMVLERSRMDNLATVHFTGRDIEEGKVDIERTPGGGWQKSSNRKPLDEELDVTPERLEVLKAIYAGHRRTGDIANATGKSPSNASNQLHDLKNDGHVKKIANGKYELASGTDEIMRQYGESAEIAEPEASNIVQDGDSTLDAVQVDGEQAVNPVYVPPEEGRSSGLPS